MRGYDGWYTGPLRGGEKGSFFFFRKRLSTIFKRRTYPSTKRKQGILQLTSHPRAPSSASSSQPIESDSDLSRNPPLAGERSFPWCDALPFTKKIINENEAELQMGVWWTVAELQRERPRPLKSGLSEWVHFFGVHSEQLWISTYSPP